MTHRTPPHAWVALYAQCRVLGLRLCLSVIDESTDPRHPRGRTPRLAGEIPSPVWPVGSGPQRLALVDVGGGHLVAPEAAAESLRSA